MQFIGSNNIGNTAKEETLRLNLGKAFNLVVNGKVTKVNEKELSRTQNDKNGCYNTSLLKTYDVSVNFNNAEKEDNNNESSLHCSLKYYLSSSFDSSSQEEKEINISGDNLPRITKRAITETQIEWKLQKCRTKRRSIYYTNDGTLVNLLKTKTNNNLCCYDYSGDYFNRKRNTICLLRPIAHPGNIANKNNVIKKEK